MSIFALPQEPVPLASTGAISYRQVDLSTGLQVTNFTQNQHTFRWALDGNTWWIPQRSYIRVRAKFQRSDKASPPVLRAITASDGIAPSYGFCNTLFQSIQHDMSGSTVSSISNYVPQIDVLRYRTSKNESWRASLGASANCYQPFVARQNRILRPVDSKDAVPQIVEYTRQSLQEYKPSTASLAIITATTCVSALSGVLSMNEGLILSSVVTAPTVLDKMVSSLTLSGSAVWSAYPERIAIGDWIIYSSSTTIRHRSQIVSILGNILYVYPAVADAAASATWNIIVEHVIEKNETSSSNDIEFLWSPPLSLWQDVAHAIPSSVHELRLTANNNWKKDCVQTMSATQNDFADVQITDMKLFLSCVDGPPVGNTAETYVLNMSDWTLNMSQVPQQASTASQILATFDVSSSVTQLAFAFQSMEVSNQNNPVGLLVSSNGTAEWGLRRFYIQYAGQQRPTPDSDSKFDQTNSVGFGNNSSVVDYTTQRWMESIINTSQLYAPGGVETKEEWTNLGPYYYFAWPKNPSDISTRVSVNYTMDNSYLVAGVKTYELLNLLLFSRGNTAHQISLANGRVVGVQTELVFGAPTMTTPQAGSGMAGGARNMMYKY